MDKVNVLNKSETVKFMGTYRVYDRRKYNSISREINDFLNKYGEVNVNSKKIKDSGMKFTTVSFNFEIWNFSLMTVLETAIKNFHYFFILFLPSLHSCHPVLSAFHDICKRIGCINRYQIPNICNYNILFLLFFPYL